jgi:hypothetical protein
MAKTIALDLPKEVNDALEDAALRYQWTEAEVICAALRFYLLDEGPPHFKWIGSIDDPTLKAAEVDNLLAGRLRVK